VFADSSAIPDSIIQSIIFFGSWADASALAMDSLMAK
jgi:hypothetical protein